MGARFTSARLPGCDHLTFRSDEYWTCYARRYSVTLHHPVGTCSMGSVVDTELRVLGTRNLRVIDASIQPQSVITNTQASTLMIGEKGADMILRYWSGQNRNQGKSENKKPWFDILDEDGGKRGFKRGNNEQWWGNKKQFGAVLDGPVRGLSGNYFSRQQRRNSSGVKRGRNQQVGISSLRGIVLEQDFEVPIQPIPARHKIPNYNSEAEMVKKLKQSLEQLRMVSDITKENYDGYWQQQQQTPKKQRPSEKIRLTTSRVPTSTRNSGKQNEFEYYYKDNYNDEGYSSGGDRNKVPPFYQSNNSVRGRDGEVPRPPPPPQPPRITGQYLPKSLSSS